MYSTLEKLMKQKGVTAYQVCKATGLAQSTISDWKMGRYTPKVEKLMKLAEYFDVPLETFLKK